MGMRKLKIKIFLKNTFYRKSNGNLISQLHAHQPASFPRQLLGLLRRRIVRHHLLYVLYRVRVAARIVQLPAPAWHTTGPALALVCPADYSVCVFTPCDIDESVHSQVVLLVQQLHLLHPLRVLALRRQAAR